MSKDFRFNKFDKVFSGDEGEINLAPRQKKTARRGENRQLNDYSAQRRIKKERGGASELY